MENQIVKKILLIGEVSEDIFTYGHVNRICPEAPVPILDVDFDNSDY